MRDAPKRRWFQFTLWTRIIAAVLWMLWLPELESQEIVAAAALGTPVSEHADHKAGWNGHVDHVQWAGNNIICSGRSGFVRCFDPKTKRQLWSVQLEGEIDCLSVASTKDRLFVLTKSRALLSGSIIREMRISDGKQTNLLSTDQLRRQATESLFMPNRIAWVPLADQLLVTSFSKKYGENGLMLDAGTFKKAATIKCDGFVTDITPVGGRFIVTLSDQNNIRIWDTKSGKETFRHGKDNVAAIDAPFISNAKFDGERTLVYTVDNSWATGKVFIHDTLEDKEVACFDSRNGHAVMDVDFAHGRIALTGTERMLTIVDLTGKLISNKKAVTFQRNVAIVFSPNGERLVIGSWDNTVRVFDIR